MSTITERVADSDPLLRMPHSVIELLALIACLGFAAFVLWLWSR